MPSTRFMLHAASVVALGMIVAPVQGQDASRSVEGGGISVPGWMGKIDAREAEAGQVLENASLVAEGQGLHVTTGPAVTYWNPANRATGSYTVSATFSEPAFMSLNNHPHPFGIVVAGNGMGTDQQSYLYCAAYGNGSFIVRGFGPEPFQMNGRRAEANSAVNSVEPGEPVTQEITVSVTQTSVSCAINGTVVATYPKGDLVTEGRLASTDGLYGLRFGHNTEAVVTGLSMTSN